MGGLEAGRGLGAGAGTSRRRSRSISIDGAGTEAHNSGGKRGTLFGTGTDAG